MSAPTPTNTPLHDVRALFSPDDMPAEFESAGESKVVLTRTTVRPDGTAECIAEANSRDRNLDALTCAIIVRRAKFRPARWMDGSTVYGVLRIPIAWLISDSIPPEGYALGLSDPDLDLSVDRLPKGAHSTTGVLLEVAADPSGHPVACVEFPPSPRDSFKHFPELVAVACQQAMTNLTVVPPLDATGKPVRSVQTVSARFKIDRK